MIIPVNILKSIGTINIIKEDTAGNHLVFICRVPIVGESTTEAGIATTWVHNVYGGFVGRAEILGCVCVVLYCVQGPGPFSFIPSAFIGIPHFSQPVFRLCSYKTHFVARQPIFNTKNQFWIDLYPSIPMTTLLHEGKVVIGDKRDSP